MRSRRSATTICQSGADRMKAVRLYDALDLRVEEVDRPLSPPAGYVTIDVRAAGICGSDLHNYRTGQWISRHPSTAGHEFCGRVSAIGEGVEGLAIGDLVAADSRFYCGQCEACRSGRTNICEHLGFVGEVCDGGIAEQAQLPARLVFKHEPSLDPAVAAMAEPLAVALHAIRRLNPPQGEAILLVGCGTIGGLCGLLLSHLHDGKLLFTDLNGSRAEMVAAICGGSVVALDKSQARTALGDARLRYAVDATGSTKAIARGIELLEGAAPSLSSASVTKSWIWIPMSSSSARFPWLAAMPLEANSPTPLRCCQSCSPHFCNLARSWTHSTKSLMRTADCSMVAQPN